MRIVGSNPLASYSTITKGVSMWLFEPVKIVLFWATLFLLRPNFCCQYHRKIGPEAAIYDVNKLATMDDVMEYQSLLHTCKTIKSQMTVIADHRMSLKDAVETSITLYLLGVKGPVAKILLADIKANEFIL